MTVRTAFLHTAEEVARLLRGDVVASAWASDSALREMTVGALAAHLGRAVLTTEHYLALDPPGDDVAGVAPVDYFVASLGDGGIDDEVNVGIRTRASEAAAGGAEALASEVDGTLHRLRPLLADAPADRRVAVFRGQAMRLDEYLETRVLEMVVHLDDLAVSVGRESIEVPEEAGELVVGLLARIARRRSSTSAVVRHLARRERAPEGGVYAF